MSETSLFVQASILFCRMTARSVKVGDIVKTRWGLRELLEYRIEEGDVWMWFRDNKFVCGEYATMEVLVP